MVPVFTTRMVEFSKYKFASTVKVVPDAIVYVAFPVGENFKLFIVTEPVIVQVAVNFIVPLLCVKLPLLKVKFELVVNVPLVLVKAQPEIVQDPVNAMLALPPANVPPLNVAQLVPIVIVFVD